MNNNLVLFNPMTKLHFAVYRLKIVDGYTAQTEHMIVLKDSSGIVVEYTGLERYCTEYKERKLSPRITHSRKATSAVCKALNFIFLNYNVRKLADITANMVREYFEYYRSTPVSPDSEQYCSQQSLDNCIQQVSYFFANLCKEHPMALRPDELVEKREISLGQYNSKKVVKYMPIYTMKRHQSADRKLLRDMPVAAMSKLLALAYRHDPMIALGIILQSMGGLRPSEVVNVRQATSPVSGVPGISIRYEYNAVKGVAIDLTREFQLRSDGVSVGGIKKERTVNIYKSYIPFVYQAYMLHLRFLDRNYANKIEPEYMPMFLARNGKALTYDSYRKRIKYLGELLREELLNDSDATLVGFGQKLLTANLTPHTFRHFFSVEIVKKGLDIAQIMNLRGDESPTSALVYLVGKGELMKEAERIQSDYINSVVRR